MVQEGACDWEAPCLLIRLCSMVPCAHTDVNQILKAALKFLHRPAHLYSERLPEESHPFIDALVPCVMRYPLESLTFLLDQIATSLPGWYETAPTSLDLLHALLETEPLLLPELSKLTPQLLTTLVAVWA